MGFFDKLKAGLTRTKQQILELFDELVQRADAPEQRTRQIDVDTIEALEEILIGADIGIAATPGIDFDAGRSFLESLDIDDPFPDVSEDFDLPLAEDFLTKPLPPD